MIALGTIRFRHPMKPRFPITLILFTLLLSTVSCRKAANAPEQVGIPAAEQNQDEPSAIAASVPVPAGASSETSRTDSAAAATQTKPEVSPTDRLAYTGHYGSPSGSQALIEDVVLRLQTFKKVGQQAFGYTVKEIETDWVVLEREGTQFQLMFGKKETPAVPDINSSNYPSAFVQTAESLTRPQPAPPPPESQIIQPIRPDQIPADVQAKLQERLRGKARRAD